MKKPIITKLTKEQEARFPEFVKKWIDIGLCTKPADREKAERAIKGLYVLAKLREPRVIWLPCPISAALSSVVYAQIISKRLDVKPAVRSAVYSAVYSAVGSAVDSAVDSAVRSAVYSAVGSAVGSAVYSAVGSAVDSAVGSAVGSAVYSAVGSAVGSAVDSAVGSAVDSAVYSAVDSAVYSAVGSAVGSAVDSAVYSAVGSAVDSAVYSAVDSAVRSAVDSAVGSAVDSAVYSAVYSAVGSAVDSAVYSAGQSFFGGSLRSGYESWADYLNEVCGIAIDRSYLEATESCGFYWTLDSVCFASERPTSIIRNAAGQLHCETAHSIVYPSGWGMYHLNGIKMEAKHVLTPAEKLDPTECLKEKNADIRRELVRKIGVEMMLSHLPHKVLDKRDDYELLRIDFPDLVQDTRFLKMVNPSIGCFHVEGVERECNTVEQAINWRAAGAFGKDIDWKPEIVT